jgi:uncharacterized protein YndB with AHSA1/START domain
MSETEQAAVERSTTHSTFVIERTYGAAPQKVFDAWADPAAKSRWFGPPQKGDYSLDFRVGGVEHFTASGPGGALYTFDSRYMDIVPGLRIVHCYDMLRDDTRISVSVATIEFEAQDTGTRLTLTEYGVYLDGQDTGEQREHGTKEMIEALGAYVDGEGAGQ